MKQTGTVEQVSTSPGGIPKRAVDVAHFTPDGITGDWQKSRKYHGGPDRAVCLYSVELYAWLRKRGVDLSPGAVGENLTTRGIDLDSLAVGSRLRVGMAMIELTDVRIPCATLKKCDPLLPKLIKGHSGWVAKILEAGAVRAGDGVEVLR